MFPFVLPTDRKLQPDEIDALMAFLANTENDGAILTMQQCRILAKLGFNIATAGRSMAE